jgi:dephospho-CoA kinase
VEHAGTTDHALAGTHRRPLVVGLTGGIGSGKTSVSAVFESLGVPVIDADQLAHQLVAPGQAALDEIREAFGQRCITADGHLDRAFIRQRVFSNPDEKQKLESILHPRIRNRIVAWIAGLESPYCLVVIPLLLETGQTDLVDRVLVVDTPENVQLTRVAARDGLSHNAILAIMDSQTDRETRLAAADDIIENSSDIASLESRVRKLHSHYLEISHDNWSR